MASVYPISDGIALDVFKTLWLNFGCGLSLAVGNLFSIMSGFVATA